MGIHARRRAAAGAVVAVVAVAAVLLAGAGSTPGAPPDAAVRLVPAGTLVYVHLSLDTRREPVRRALALAEGFPGFAALRAGILTRLTDPGCGLGRSALRGDEAAVAITAAGSLVLLDTGSTTGRPAPRACGAVAAARLGRFLVLGAPAAVTAARGVAAGRVRSLATQPDYRRARADLPAARFADGYISAAGLRTLLAPRGGLAQIAAQVLDRDGLTGLGFAAQAGATGLRVTIDELAPGAGTAGTFSPQLLDRMPAGAVAALDTRDIGAAVQRMGGVLGAVSAADQRRLARALPGETALWLTPHGTDTPTLTLINERSEARGAPTAVGALALHPAVIAGHLVLSTRLSGLAAVRAVRGRLRDSAAFRSVLDDAPARISALGFLDFSELLRLGEQTGLDANRAYQRVEHDLGRVRAVGAVSTGDADHTTVQVELSIP